MEHDTQSPIKCDTYYLNAKKSLSYDYKFAAFYEDKNTTWNSVSLTTRPLFFNVIMKY